MKTIENVALEVLKGKCKKVETKEEGEVVIALLESVLRESNFYYISAPEIDIKKQVAIIRFYFRPNEIFSIDLINPIIIKAENKLVAFGEQCLIWPHNYYNCLRYNDITILNGLDQKEIVLNGPPAFIVQHQIDHLNGILMQDRTIKLAIAREDGIIKDRDRCPCNGGERFFRCCKNKP
jgi:peptide deformylase